MNPDSTEYSVSMSVNIRHFYVFTCSDTDGKTAVTVETMNFPGTATKDGTFTDELKDKDSPQYKQLAQEFCGEVSKNVLKKRRSSPLKYKNVSFAHKI